MLAILALIIVIVYSVSLFMLFLYSLSQLSLAINYIKAHRSKRPSLLLDLNQTDTIPFVTIQLPIFNEKYVIERLLDCIGKLNYPKNKMEIQLLDDSNDGTFDSTGILVHDLQNKGLNILHIHRENRIDYKAGALKEGLTSAKGDLIAIFDADFLPQPDWLIKTVEYFNDAKVGVVQTRWGHTNKNYSLLTKVQAFALDTHFSLEQTGRNSKGHFINFNGTAGIWRKLCIIDAGNWEGDTLTEDLDLSYRAQLKQWHFVYLENVVTPAELPVVISAARSQQFRWNKGGAQNFLKLYKKVLFAKNLPLVTKFHGLLHLINSSMFFFILIISLLSVPVLYIKKYHPHLAVFFSINIFFVSSTIILFFCYWIVYKSTYKNLIKRFFDFMGIFFAFFTICLGFSLHNMLAVTEAYMGKKSEFIRTPKFNITKLTDTWKGNQYLSRKLPFNIVLEGILVLYFGFGICSAFYLQDYSIIPYHFMLLVGFLYIFINSINSKN